MKQAWEQYIVEWCLYSFDFTNNTYQFNGRDFQNSRCYKTFVKTCQKEPRLLCYQVFEDSRPDYFRSNNLFIVPISRTRYCIVKGDGYFKLFEGREILKVNYPKNLATTLITLLLNSSENSRILFLFNTGIIDKLFSEPENKLHLTFFGRMTSPELSFNVSNTKLTISGVQFEIDACYESNKCIFIFESKIMKRINHNLGILIRQIFIPYISLTNILHTRLNKQLYSVYHIYEEKTQRDYFWKFNFTDIEQYNSINLLDTFFIHYDI